MPGIPNQPRLPSDFPANHCWAKDGSKTLPSPRQAKHSPIELHTHRGEGDPENKHNNHINQPKTALLKKKKGKPISPTPVIGRASVFLGFDTFRSCFLE